MATTIIDINNLSVKFGTHTALCKICLRVNNGSFVSIVGPNGGGKSTLLKAMLGLIQPTDGTIKIFGVNPTEVKSNLIGYVPQIKTLDRSFPALPIELVATGIQAKWAGFSKKPVQLAAMEALDSVGALHLAKRPLRLLSGGELQRVYLARSIVRKPKLLLLDEPATGIDFTGEKDINNLIEKYCSENDASVIMVTHDWEVAYHHADFVLMLNCSQVCYEIPEIAFSETPLRKTFGHIGHAHEMIFGGKK